MSDETRAAVDPSRRLFCVSACHAASALALGAVLPGCGGGGNPAGPSGGGAPAPTLTVINAPASGGTATVAIDAGSPLSAVGGAALVRTGTGDLLVARTAQDAFSALTATCTHEACLITGYRSPNFVCPCHGSQFSTSGAVLNGPATRALRTYSTTFSGSTLTIAL
jgi:cytochrome b6-f complex iron-sulfur subunit